MYHRTTRLVQALTVVLLLPFLQSCGVAAGAAAGTAAGLAYSDRGAETDVVASPDKVATATNATFREMGITTTETETDREDNKIKIKGAQGDRDVVVDIDGKESGTTHIEVTVKKNVVDYDRDRAAKILSNIMGRL